MDVTEKRMQILQKVVDRLIEPKAAVLLLDELTRLERLEAQEPGQRPDYIRDVRC